MAEKKHFGDCPECGAPCEVIETSYIEEGHEVHFVEHKYSHRGVVWVKASERLPGLKTPVKWRQGETEMKTQAVWYMVMDSNSEELSKFEWLDESPAEQPGREVDDLKTFLHWLTRDSFLELISGQWAVKNDEDGTCPFSQERIIEMFKDQ